MSVVLEIEKNQRKVISILFRVVVISYSIFFLWFKGNAFHWYINIGIFFIYILFYYLLHGKDKIFAILRVINDYAFITAILYGNTKLDIYSIALIFAPILNTQNHSSEKRTFILYILPFFSFYILSMHFDWSLIIPMFMFFLINYFEFWRTKYIQFHEKLTEEIDKFYLENMEKVRPHKIYKRIILILNEKNIFPFYITNIYCFKTYNRGTFVINGSEFIYKYEISKFLKYLEAHKFNGHTGIAINFPIEINGIPHKNTICIACLLPEGLYTFYLTHIGYNRYGLPRNYILALLEPFFHRFSNVLEADLKRKSFELLKLQEIEEKINYVSNAVNAMHFIRNKLGPVKNYLAMVVDYEKSDTARKELIDPYLQKERQKLNSSFNQVLERADQILKNSSNPFNVTALKDHGIQQLFADVRRIWSYFFDIEHFSTNLLPDSIGPNYMTIKYNDIGMELVLSNWISNMKKFNNGTFGVDFEESEQFFKMRFYNSVNTEESNPFSFIKEFSSDDRIEVIRRKSHGISEIKEFLTQMSISSKMEREKDYVYLILDFLKYKENENINL